MTLRNYIGFSTTAFGITESTDPTTVINPPFLGIFNTSLEDYYGNVAPSISGSTKAESGGVAVGSLAVNVPSNIAGDLLLTFICCSNSGRTFSSSGWTVEAQNTAVTPSFSILSKISLGSEPSSYTFLMAGGNATISAIMVSVSKYKSYSIGSFGAQRESPVISVPDDSSKQKLLIFGISNNGSGRSWNINTITEYELQLTSDPSLDVSAIYRTVGNTSLTYTAAQSGAGSNSYGISVVIQ